MTQIVPCFGFRHEVCEAEQEVCQHDNRPLVESLYVVGRSVFEWLVPLNVDGHAERDQILSGKLDPKIISKLEHDYDESHSSQEKHHYEN